MWWKGRIGQTGALDSLMCMHILWIREKIQIQTQWVLGGSWESTFLASPLGMPLLLVHRHFEQQGNKSLLTALTSPRFYENRINLKIINDFYFSRKQQQPKRNLVEFIFPISIFLWKYLNKRKFFFLVSRSKSGIELSRPFSLRSTVPQSNAELLPLGSLPQNFPVYSSLALLDFFSYKDLGFLLTGNRV